MTRCWFVDDHRADYPVKRLCELVELPRATFYWWANSTLRNESLMTPAWRTRSSRSTKRGGGTYGSPPVWPVRRRRIQVGEKRVARVCIRCRPQGAARIFALFRRAVKPQPLISRISSPRGRTRSS